MAERHAVIQIRGLTYTIGGQTIIDHVDLDIYEAEIFAVMGLSGAGKTTMLRLLAGLIRPSEGSIQVLGRDITVMGEDELNTVRKDIGFVFQYGALFDSLTVEQNVGFSLYEHTSLSGREVRGKVAEKLRMVRLPGIEELHPAELSGGMQKRVGIARALMVEPRVLLYDEPTSGLDPIIAATIDDLIVSLRDTLEVTAVVVSHDVASVMRKADRVAFLYEGKLRLIRTPEQFRASADPAVRQFLAGSTQGPIQVA